MTSATAAPQIKCDATRSRYRLFMAFGLVFALVAALVALALGRFHLTLAQTAATLISPWLDESSVTPAMQSVIFNVRLPRVLLALAAGAGLAAAGAAFQSLFSNPLATPDTLGVATGSAFGAVLGLLLGLEAFSVQIASLAMGLAAVALVYAVSSVRGRATVLMLILSGLVIAAFFSALIALVKYAADPQDVLPAITFWLMGSMTGATMKALTIGLPFIVIGCLVIHLLRWKLNALSLSPSEARALGLRLPQLRAVVIVACTMVSASVVSMCGLIGWVGLLIPHFVRLVVGSNNVYVVPASALWGAIFVLLCDTVARTATQMEIPVCILTAVLGAPVFLLLLRRGSSARL